MKTDQINSQNDSNKNEGSISEITDPDKLDNDDEVSSIKPSHWKKYPQITDLKQDLQYARQENTDQCANVEGWLALRDASGVESGNKCNKPGRSKFQPKLIRKHNEWRYPPLSEPFLNSERMFNINPRTFEDKNAAKQNEIVINWQFDTKINKVDFIDRVVRTTVDEGTCILRIGWKREYKSVKVTKPLYKYEEITDPQELNILTEATKLYVNNSSEFQKLPDDLQASVIKSSEEERPLSAEQYSEEESIEEVMVSNQPDIKIIDIRNFYIDPSCDGVWQDAQYMIYTYETTQSNLKSQNKYKNLDKVNWGANDIKSKTGDIDHTSTSPSHDSRINTDKSNVLVYEYWGLYDIYDNGVMVPILVTWIGDTIIQMIENPFPDNKSPFVIIPYMPILKSSFGEADASLLQDNQRILGATTRGMIDLLGRSANAQTGYAKGFLDPVNRQRFSKGEDFEFNPNGDPRTNIQQLTYPDIPNSALQISQLQNAEAEGLSGVKSFAGGITGDAYGKVARGISGALDAAGQREMSILRRIAEGMRLVGTKIVAMNQVFLSENEVIRITNQEFIEIKKEDLAGNFDLMVDISTQSVDEAKSQDLGFMLQTQGPNMDPGLEQIILGEIADLKRMPYLAQRIREYKPEPDPLDQELKQLQIDKLKADIELDKARAAEALARAENTALDTEMDATGTSHERAIETAGAQAKGNRHLEVTKKLLEGTSPANNISAAVGFNQLTEQNDSRRTDLPTPPQIPPQIVNSPQTNVDIPPQLINDEI